jgi:hypothetical protein
MRKRKFYIYKLILFILFYQIACLPTSTEKPNTISQIPIFLDKEFTLMVGQTGLFQLMNLSITFNKVISDSRCPSDVICIWTGEVQIEVLIKIDEQQQTVIMSDKKNQYNFSNLELNLLKVEPYPTSRQQIKPSDYKATFILQSFK